MPFNDAIAAISLLGNNFPVFFSIAIILIIVTSAISFFYGRKFNFVNVIGFLCITSVIYVIAVDNVFTAPDLEKSYGIEHGLSKPINHTYSNASIPLPVVATHSNNTFNINSLSTGDLLT